MTVARPSNVVESIIQGTTSERRREWDTKGKKGRLEGNEQYENSDKETPFTSEFFAFISASFAVPLQCYTIVCIISVYYIERSVVIPFSHSKG